MRVVITGAQGLLGFHTSALFHAQNCQSQYDGHDPRYEIIRLDKAKFNDDNSLSFALKKADVILHFAGVNRGTDQKVASGNPQIARRLIKFCRRAGVSPHIVYANSVHFSQNTVYGKSKRIAGELLSDFTHRYTDLILPHVFGEFARPHYNSAVATFIHQIVTGQAANVNPRGHVQLLHVGHVAELALNAVLSNAVGQFKPSFYPLSVSELYEKLKIFHENYQSNIYPNLSCEFNLALFNSYRAATFPDYWPRCLQLNTDHRGMLFEAVKGGGGGQTFLSSTKPGVTRGNHFHLRKVERFIVIQGEAIIQIRKILTDECWEYKVSGDNPVAIDIPTLCTHSIKNVGDEELLTVFWSHDIFDPKNSDTYVDKVLK